MSDEGSKRTVVLTVEQDDPRAGHAHIYAVDTDTGEKIEVLGVSHATICLNAAEPTTVHLEVIPDKINVSGILTQVEEDSFA